MATMPYTKEQLLDRNAELVRINDKLWAQVHNDGMLLTRAVSDVTALREQLAVCRAALSEATTELDNAAILVLSGPKRAFLHQFANKGRAVLAP